MKIQIDRAPMSRGVTHLMYVGDDEAVEKALKPTGGQLAIGAAAVLVALQSRGITRLAAAAVAAFVGYRAYKAR